MKALSHYRMLGGWDTFRHGLAGLLTRPGPDRFDRKYGTDTGGVLMMRQDERPEPGQMVRSLPTHPKVLRYILKSLEIDYRNFVFVDFGCGKGRALLCASDFPFARIVGVEWSMDLHRICARNLELYRSPRQNCFDIEVRCMNVLDYEFPALPTVLYMYNPFGPKITTHVFENACKSVAAAPRRFLVIFSGLGAFEEKLVMDCFDRFGIEVLKKVHALTAWGSWVLGEVRIQKRVEQQDAS